MPKEGQEKTREVSMDPSPPPQPRSRTLWDHCPAFRPQPEGRRGCGGPWGRGREAHGWRQSGKTRARCAPGTCPSQERRPRLSRPRWQSRIWVKGARPGGRARGAASRWEELEAGRPGWAGERDRTGTGGALSLSPVVASGHAWLVSAQNGAASPEELNFSLPVAHFSVKTCT